jgi:hypothetical protein
MLNGFVEIICDEGVVGRGSAVCVVAGPAIRIETSALYCHNWLVTYKTLQ